MENLKKTWGPSYASVPLMSILEQPSDSFEKSGILIF